MYHVNLGLSVVNTKRQRALRCVLCGGEQQEHLRLSSCGGRGLLSMTNQKGYPHMWVVFIIKLAFTAILYLK